MTNLTGEKKDFYDSLSFGPVPEAYRSGYQKYKKMLPALEEKFNNIQSLINNLRSANLMTNAIVNKIAKTNPALGDFQNYKPINEDEKIIIKIIQERWPLYSDFSQLKENEVDNLLRLALYHKEHGLNINNNEPDTALWQR